MNAVALIAGALAVLGTGSAVALSIRELRDARRAAKRIHSAVITEAEINRVQVVEADANLVQAALLEDAVSRQRAIVQTLEEVLKELPEEARRVALDVEAKRLADEVSISLQGIEQLHGAIRDSLDRLQGRVDELIQKQPYDASQTESDV
jgi:hypothetical protein